MELGGKASDTPLFVPQTKQQRDVPNNCMCTPLDTREYKQLLNQEIAYSFHDAISNVDNHISLVVHYHSGIPKQERPMGEFARKGAWVEMT